MTTDPMDTLRAGLRVGLLGGSFDPAHAGHVHLSREALRRFALDRVIWLASPGNPLKPNPPAPLETRVAQARALIEHPRIQVSPLEARIGTRMTADTLAHVVARWPGVRFVWLMGADNMAQLHRWDRWHAIMRTMPVGVLARPGHRLAARLSPAARIYHAARLPDRAAPLLAGRRAPAWCFATMPLLDVSSSAIRSQKG